jgi:8-oxo-dGTP pyrophosphatase MutT (NUDIX family)
VVARSESWSRPLDAGQAGLVAAAALFLLAVSWLALHHGFYREEQIRDTALYQRYGDLIADGRVPYRDFRVEYPPAALPAFAVPSLLAPGEGADSFRRWFEWLMLGCGAVLVVLVASTLVSLGRGPPETAGALVFVALAPLALGSVVLSRFDLWPAALTAGAIAALVAGRDRLGFAVLGLGIAAKIYPAVLLPLFLIRVWRRRGRREALVATGLLAAVVGVCVLPFLVVAPGGVWASVERQLSRPLQIESLGAGFLLAAHQAFGVDVTVRSSHGSQNLAGTVPELLAIVQSLAQAAALVAVWVLYARGPADRERLVRHAAAGVCAFVALGKVASPQFLIWLVPLVALVRGRRGLAAGALLAVAAVLTQIWFPYRYWDLVFELEPVASWLVPVRDLVLVGLLLVLAAPGRRSEAERGLDATGWVTSDGRPVSREPPYGASVLVWRRAQAGREWLVLHRAHEGPGYEGDWAWGPPSGARLPGESVEACARRELREETGLELEPVGTACGSEDWALFEAEVPRGSVVTLSPEHDAYLWLPLEEAAARCRPLRVNAGLRAVAAEVARR